MGLLVDELIKTGMTKNIKNNLQQIEKMVQMIKEHPTANNKLEDVVRFACERLKKMGYEYDTSKILKLIKP